MVPPKLGFLVLLLASAAPAQSVDPRAIHSPDGKPLSQRVVAYNIDARLDVKAKTVDATEVLVYRNLTGQPLDTFPFHLYLNAFQPQSTWMREAHLSGWRDWPQDRAWSDRYRGEITLRRVQVDGMGDLTSQVRFVAPDDGNADDKTVAEIKLPRAVPPGGSVTFRLQFHDKFPQAVARNGYEHDFIMGGQWFPKVGVWWHGAWNCHQYHAATEFFSDFGTYDVKLTLARNYVVGASGYQVSSRDNADGTKTVVFHGEDIHDFAWAACPRFVAFDGTFNGSAGPVRMHALVLPSHAGQGRRYLEILKETLQRFDQWYGPYPYTQITLIDPEPGSAAGGMEYPTLFTAGTVWRVPRGLRMPELVTEHEFGHQYWYGIVASNEFEEAWLDEGINSYVEGKVMDSIFGRDTSILHLGSAHMGEQSLMRAEYRGVAETDPLERKAWLFMGYGSYGGVTYAKTALFLDTLESMVGEDTVRQGLHTYFLRYRFQHPDAQDFLHTMEEVSGRNLEPFFQQAVYGTQVLDYSVQDVSSQPLRWWEHGKDGKDRMYRNEVVLQRKGDFIFPVKLEVKFANGEVAHESWDGVDRWVRYTYDRKSRLVSAEIDPQHQVALDRNLLNNSKTVGSHPAAVHKLANYWLVATQWFQQLVTWLI